MKTTRETSSSLCRDSSQVAIRAANSDDVFNCRPPRDTLRERASGERETRPISVYQATGRRRTNDVRTHYRLSGARYSLFVLTLVSQAALRTRGSACAPILSPSPIYHPLVDVTDIGEMRKRMRERPRRRRKGRRDGKNATRGRKRRESGSTGFSKRKGR